MKIITIQELQQRQQRDSIDALLDSGLSFALFRRPIEEGAKPESEDVELVLQTKGEARTVKPTETELDGFVFAPFHETLHRPTLLIRPDVEVKGWEAITETTHGLGHPQRVKLTQLDHFRSHYLQAEHNYFYKDNYERLMKQIAQERFEKLVLTYCEEVPFALQHKEAQVFLKALKAYPNAMVYLCYTPKGGRWIGCTPELLLRREGDNWQTMALAGTSTWGEGDWNTKNVHEQDVVRRYIEDTLKGLGADVVNSRCHTMQIGRLMHRRTDFNFSFPTATHTMDVARTLHPTPAVCGLPKDEAYRYLLKNEHSCRNYFTGYLGPIHGDSAAHLYVNLRCAQICQYDTYFHAGGGLTCLSRLDEEAREIDLKIQQLLQLC